MDLASLRRAPLDELEARYRDTPLAAPPSGIWRGEVLRRLDALARRPLVRALDWALFEKTPFGIDFRRRLWWFWHPRLAAGRFVISPGPSRWREAETYRLEYAVSRLPGRGLLYDELKPLSADLALGIGGLDGARGEGDHFFFVLHR